MIEQVPRTATVYTPDALAQAMACSLGDEPGARWLEPCIGAGAFVRALAKLGIDRKRITAFDLEWMPAESDVLAQTQRGRDFIAWVSSEGKSQHFERVIMNPPYVALSRVRGAPRGAALDLRLPDGTKPTLRWNYWSVFLVAALRVVSPGGALVAVLPAAFEFAEYATPVRELFLRSFEASFVFRSRVPLFPDVKEGAVVVVGRGFARRPQSMRRVLVQDAGDMIHGLTSLAGGGGSVAGAIARFRKVRTVSASSKRLCELVDIRIGGVTGDADYFLLNDDKRKKWELPPSALRPVLSKASHLQAALMDRGMWEKLRKVGERVWLFHPPERMRAHPAVRQYIELPREQGGCRRERFKVSNRDPWFITPLPTHVDGFMSGMSRHLPFLVLKGKLDLAATNTLYIVCFREPCSLEEKAAWAVSLLSTEVRRQLKGSARTYADGLLKFEPGELGSIVLPEPTSTLGAVEVLKRATSKLLSGDQEAASREADTWLRNPKRYWDAAPKVIHQNVHPEDVEVETI